MGELKRGIALSKLREYESRKERHNQAQVLVDERRLFRACKLFRENVDWSLKTLGQDHETTVYDQETLAYALNELGHSNVAKNRAKNDDSENPRTKELFEEARDLDALALETRTRVEGTSPPSKDLLDTQRNLANDYVSLEIYRKASRLFQENYEARRVHPDLGEDHEFTLRAGHDLAGCWYKRNWWKKAKALNEKMLEARIRLKRPEAEIGKSRNALYWNNYMIREYEKGKAQEKENSGEQKNSNSSSSKGGGTDSGKDQGAKGKRTSEVGQTSEKQSTKNQGSPESVSIPSITYRYLDPRASEFNQADSDSSSIMSGSSTSNLPFRRDSSRPATPQITDADPDQRSKKLNPKSPIFVPTKATGNSDNLKPTDNNKGKNTGLNRARSVSDYKNKDKPKRPSRAKSTSPSAADRTYFRQLSDAGPGKDDEDSAREVEKWFYRFQTETQALLEPLRRDRGKRVKIAILDTGVDIDHPYFAADQAQEPRRRRIKSREDFLVEGGNAEDTCGHGTHSVGILRKIAPEADIYIARVAKDFDHDLDPEAVARAIYRACRDKKDEDGTRNWDVDIITMSFGFYEMSKSVQKAIQEALYKPVLVFAAASNNGSMKEVTFPAWLGGVMCINSATALGTSSRFNPDTKAPNNFSILGEDIRSAWTRTPGNPNSEKVMSGTSVATLIAAAVAALVLEFVLQNDPESVLIEQLEDLKHQDGMPEVFTTMARSEKEHRNIVPWALLSAKHGRRTVTSRIEHALRQFRGV